MRSRSRGETMPIIGRAPCAPAVPPPSLDQYRFDEELRPVRWRECEQEWWSKEAAADETLRTLKHEVSALEVELDKTR
jgi:hypothetical protein